MRLHFGSDSLFALASVDEISMRKALQPLPLHPLQLAHSQADLHFRPPGPPIDQVALFTAATTPRAFPPSLAPSRRGNSLCHFSCHLDFLCGNGSQDTKTWSNRMSYKWTHTAENVQNLRSYLWFFLCRQLWPRLCPLNRAGE